MCEITNFAIIGLFKYSVHRGHRKKLHIRNIYSPVFRNVVLASLVFLLLAICIIECCFLLLCYQEVVNEGDNDSSQKSISLKSRQFT